MCVCVIGGFMIYYPSLGSERTEKVLIIFKSMSSLYSDSWIVIKERNGRFSFRSSSFSSLSCLTFKKMRLQGRRGRALGSIDFSFHNTMSCYICLVSGGAWVSMCVCMGECFGNVELLRIVQGTIGHVSFGYVCTQIVTNFGHPHPQKRKTNYCSLFFWFSSLSKACTKKQIQKYSFKTEEKINPITSDSFYLLRLCFFLFIRYFHELPSKKIVK